MDVSTSQEKKKALKEAHGLSSQEYYFGIPHRLCISIIVFAVVNGGLLARHWVWPLVWLAVLGVPMHHIHKDDPHGFYVWMRAWGRKHKRWSAGKVGHRHLFIIEQKGDA